MAKWPAWMRPMLVGAAPVIGVRREYHNTIWRSAQERHLALWRAVMDERAADPADVARTRDGVSLADLLGRRLDPPIMG